MSPPYLLAFGEEEAQASEFKIAIYAASEYLDVCYSKKKGEGKIS